MIKKEIIVFLTNMFNGAWDLVSSLMDAAIRFVVDASYFLGNVTMQGVESIDSPLVQSIKQTLKISQRGLSYILGGFEMVAAFMIIKSIWHTTSTIYNMDYKTESKTGLKPNKSLGYHGSYDDGFYRNTGDSLGGMDNDFDFMNRQMDDLTNQMLNQQFIQNSMEECMDASMRAITPADFGGDVQGAYLNPSDTFTYEVEQSMFEDSFSGFDSFDDMSSNDCFNDFGCGGFDGF